MSSKMSLQTSAQAPNAAQLIRQHADEYNHERRQLASQIASLEREFQAKLHILQAKEEVTEKHMSKLMHNYLLEEREAIIEMMQKKLPREVRDLIYGHINTPSRRVCVKSYLHHFRDSDQIGQDTSSDVGQCESCPDRRRLHIAVPTSKIVDHEWAILISNQATVKELNEHLFRTSWFDFHANHSLIRTFLDTSYPELGIHPAALVRSLTMTLSASGRPDLAEQVSESTMEHLEALFEFKESATFYFDIFTGCDIMGFVTGHSRTASTKRFRDDLDVLFPFFMDLREEGFKVELLLDWEIQVSSEEPGFTLQEVADRVLGTPLF